MSAMAAVSSFPVTTTVFAAPDATPLARHERGTGEPLLCLPGGPMRASAYLGDLGGLARDRRLVLLDLRGTGGSGEPADPATYRVDRQVGDVEALRVDLGLERIDLLAHSAAGDLAVLYAARHPGRVRSLVLITARGRALGVDFTLAERREAADLRRDEPWYAAARPSFETVWTGEPSEADFDAATPFFYGRWDAAARAHASGEVAQTNEPAAGAYAAPGAFDPPAARAALAASDLRVLVLAGELDGGPRPAVAARIAGLFPRSRLVVQRGAGHFPWLDDPARFRGSVAAFLAGEPVRRGSGADGAGRPGTA
ncbi:alpha/beta fold hydrolase [Streptomyces fuscigenes]|uniref:alpha/beta fold hydrolase n=1 Tax=Streptomyces fuscigenes TaxID=1528880 RepID=UPI001F42125B|nr:alpha/beta hydrolase [Streptomyces fuscigenes]MCF3961648.1 alpha/beta hydrolase [Streptomyces fuscigenes]